MGDTPQAPSRAEARGGEGTGAAPGAEGRPPRNRPERPRRRKSRPPAGEGHSPEGHPSEGDPRESPPADSAAERSADDRARVGREPAESGGEGAPPGDSAGAEPPPDGRRSSDGRPPRRRAKTRGGEPRRRAGGGASSDRGETDGAAAPAARGRGGGDRAKGGGRPPAPRRRSGRERASPSAEGAGRPDGSADARVGEVEIVESASALEALADGIRRAGAFALDTEFIPENRLIPELGLVQVATADREAVVDPLAVPDLKPLFDLVADPAVRKVVHSGKHDFDIFHELGGVVPRNIFDTQVAAAVIGHQRKLQIGLRTLVAGFVGRDLSKQEQMSNWLARPLTPRQVEYAISDVRYLLPLEAKLRERARSLGRREWLEEEMRRLSANESYGPPAPEQYYRELDGPGFTAEQRGALRALTAWRERQARQANRPRGKILKDGVVRDLARRGPRNAEQLLAPYVWAEGRRPPKADPKTASQTRPVLQKNSAAILRALREGARKPIPFTGSGPVGRRPAPESLALLLETWLKLRATEHGVAPDLLATQEELRAIAAAWPKEAKGVRALAGFRRRILGEDLLLILSGKAVIQVGGKNAPADRPPIRLARLGVLGRLSLRSF